jgi:three-Cys-motif partner protein
VVVQRSYVLSHFPEIVAELSMVCRGDRHYSKEINVGELIAMSAQSFGGNWSLMKLDAVEEYLRFYAQALKRQPFRRLYIDAFAGTGSFEFAEGAMPLLAEDGGTKTHEGSALRATKIDPPFDRLYFIDSEIKLRALASHLDPETITRTELMPGDANEQVLKICQGLRPNERGVIFLDPFGMSVAWETLVAIAKTKALDVWYLVTLMGLTRQAALDLLRVDAAKARALTKVLGTEEWRARLYTALRSSAPDLFGGQTTDDALVRTATVNDIEKYVRERLRTIFPYVAPHPLRLGGAQFSLFFAVSNPSAKAQKVAAGIAEAILKPKR